MKILVISDTHGDIAKASEAIRRNPDIDLVIHLGDYFRDAEKLSSLFPHIKIEYIYGNSDFMVGDVAAEKSLEFEGKKIFLTHGHRYSVKWDYDKLHTKALEMDIELLLFGHTHIPELIHREGYTLLNPGSTSDPRGGFDESYAVVEIVEGKIYTKISNI